jgi:hypothetical protein
MKRIYVPGMKINELKTCQRNSAQYTAHTSRCNNIQYQRLMLNCSTTRTIYLNINAPWCAIQRADQAMRAPMQWRHSIVGRRSKFRAGLHPFSQKSGTPQPFQKLSYKEENQPKLAKN